MAKLMLLDRGETAAILVIFRGRHLCCPLEDLKQDVGGGIPPPHKMPEVVKVLRPDKLQQLDLQNRMMHWYRMH